MREAQVPEWPPEVAWPVDPKPPRAADEPELVDVLVLLRPVDVSAVETAVGARLRQYEPPERFGELEYDEYEFDDEYEFQRQPLQERRRQGSLAAGAGIAAFGGLSVVDAAGAGWHAGRDGIM